MIDRNQRSHFTIRSAPKALRSRYCTLFSSLLRSAWISMIAHTLRHARQKMRHYHVPLLLTVVSVASFRPLTTFADSKFPRDDDSTEAARKLHAQHEPTQAEHAHCRYFGCPLYPTDVHYTTPVFKMALEQIRNLKRIQVQQHAFVLSANDHAATFTLIGYKGGPLEEQINQDRAMVISPYRIVAQPQPEALPPSQQEKHTFTQRLYPTQTPASPPPAQDDAHIHNSNNTHINNSNKNNNYYSNLLQAPRILMGVFDGHAPRGELVSAYTVETLPDLLAQKLKLALVHVQTEDEEINATIQALTQTFVELDQNAPAHESGGCTATVVLQQGTKVYLANAGDSRSFLVAYRPSKQRTEVLHITREDKPSLPDERERVERMGGQVYVPVRGTSRVVYHDPRSGVPTGLAMSRSIGDWAAGKLGVIAEPIVDVFDLQTLVNSELLGDDEEAMECVAADNAPTIVDDVHIFAVSATDGMMDFLEAEEIAQILSHALFDDDGPHPISACERLIFAAANGWQQSKQGRYRDDIAISVATLRTPPKTQA